MNTERLLRFLGLAAGLLGLAAGAQAREDFPAPPESQVQEVAGNTTALGMQLAIRRFHSRLDAERVIAFYRELWGEQAALVTLPPWRMIGTQRDGRYLNVQVQADGSGSRGLLSESDLPQQLAEQRYRPAPARSDFPHMNGSKLISLSENRDAGKTSRLLQLRNDFSVAGNASFYRRHFEGQGYTLVMDEAVAPREQGRVLLFRRGAHEVRLSIHRLDGQTSIVANEVREGLLP